MTRRSIQQTEQSFRIFRTRSGFLKHRTRYRIWNRFIPGSPQLLEKRKARYSLPVLVPDMELSRGLVWSGPQSIYRVPGFLTSRRNWVPSPPHPQGSVAPLSFGSKGGETLACGEGWRTEFRRRDRHSGNIIPLRSAVACTDLVPGVLEEVADEDLLLLPRTRVPHAGQAALAALLNTPAIILLPAQHKHCSWIKLCAMYIVYTNTEQTFCI